MSKNARFAKSMAGVVCTLALAGLTLAADAGKPTPANAKVKVLILVGGHGYDGEQPLVRLDADGFAA